MKITTQSLYNQAAAVALKAEDKSQESVIHALLLGAKLLGQAPSINHLEKALKFNPDNKSLAIDFGLLEDLADDHVDAVQHFVVKNTRIVLARQQIFSKQNPGQPIPADLLTEQQRLAEMLQSVDYQVIDRKLEVSGRPSFRKSLCDRITGCLELQDSVDVRDEDDKLTIWFPEKHSASVMSHLEAEIVRTGVSKSGVAVNLEVTAPLVPGNKDIYDFSLNKNAKKLISNLLGETPSL